MGRVVHVSTFHRPLTFYIRWVSHRIPAPTDATSARHKTHQSRSTHSFSRPCSPQMPPLHVTLPPRRTSPAPSALQHPASPVTRAHAEPCSSHRVSEPPTSLNHPPSTRRTQASASPRRASQSPTSAGTRSRCGAPALSSTPSRTSASTTSTPSAPLRNSRTTTGSSPRRRTARISSRPSTRARYTPRNSTPRSRGRRGWPFSRHSSTLPVLRRRPLGTWMVLEASPRWGWWYVVAVRLYGMVASGACMCLWGTRGRWQAVLRVLGRETQPGHSACAHSMCSLASL